MRFLPTKMWLVALAIAAGGAWATNWSRAQQPTQNIVRERTVEIPVPPLASEPPQTRLISRDLARAMTVQLPGAPASPLERTNANELIRGAAEAVLAASGDEAKAAAQKKLADLLAQYYDADMARREQELKQIEDRLVKLRELLDRRHAKKQEILDLQTKVALNEAEGLGFYGGGERTRHSNAYFYGSFAPATPPPSELEVSSPLGMPTPTTIPSDDSNPFAAPADQR